VINLDKNCLSGEIKEIVESRLAWITHQGDREIRNYTFAQTPFVRKKLNSGAVIDTVLFDLRNRYLNLGNSASSTCPFCNIPETVTILNDIDLIFVHHIFPVLNL